MIPRTLEEFLGVKGQNHLNIKAMPFFGCRTSDNEQSIGGHGYAKMEKHRERFLMNLNLTYVQFF